MEVILVFCEAEKNKLEDLENAFNMTSSIPNIAPKLVPALIYVMMNQSLDDGNNTGPSADAATCLDYVSQILRDDVVPLVLPFVEKSILSQNWREREAAIMVIGIFTFFKISKND
jgi:hypothetical protein